MSRVRGEVLESNKKHPKWETTKSVRGHLRKATSVVGQGNHKGQGGDTGGARATKESRKVFEGNKWPRFDRPRKKVLSLPDHQKERID